MASLKSHSISERSVSTTAQRGKKGLMYPKTRGKERETLLSLSLSPSFLYSTHANATFKIIFGELLQEVKSILNRKQIYKQT